MSPSLAPPDKDSHNIWNSFWGADHDAAGKPIGVAMSSEDYQRLLYDLAWAQSSTPEAQREIEKAEDAYRRGDCLTSEEFFSQINAWLNQRAAS